jgi:hypothetical protein
MQSGRHLDDKLQDAADALRAVAESGSDDESVSDDKDGDNGQECRDADRDRREWLGSARVLRRLSKALLEAVDALREVASAQYREPDCDDSRECYEAGGSQPPMPPYPPYPPYAPHAPFPPYPPYPPVVVIGGSGCTCHQGVPIAGQMPASSFQLAPTIPASTPVPQSQIIQAPTIPASIPVPQSQIVQPIGAARPAAAASASSAGFPDTTNLQQVETLLDIGESAAAMVKRALSQQKKGQHHGRA